MKLFIGKSKTGDLDYSENYVLFLLFLVATFNLMDRQLMGLMIEPIKAEFQVSDTQIGILTGFSFAAAHTLAAIPIARLADIHPRKHIISIGLALWSLLTVLSGFVQSFFQLAAVRMGVGIGEAAGTPPSHAMVSDLFEPAKRAGALAIVSMGATFGVALSFLLGGWIVENYGWREAFIYLGAPGLLLALIFTMTVKEPERGRFDTGKASAPDSSALSSIKHLLSIKAYRYFLVAGSLHALATFSTLFWLPSFIARIHELDFTQIGAILALTNPTFTALGMFAGGKFIDKRITEHASWIMKPTALAMAIAAPIFALMLLINSVYALALIIPISFLYGAGLPGLHTAAQSISPPGMRAVSSAVNLVVMNIVGYGLGAAIIGMLTDNLSATMGEEAIRYSLLIIGVLALIIGAKYAQSAAKHIKIHS